MRKAGVSLDAIDGFPHPVVERLRDDLSVTTAEEFTDLANRMGPALRSLLEIDEATLDRLRALADDAAGELPPAAGEFRTGMEPPPEGRDTYSG